MDGGKLAAPCRSQKDFQNLGEISSSHCSVEVSQLKASCFVGPYVGSLRTLLQNLSVVEFVRAQGLICRG